CQPDLDTAWAKRSHKVLDGSLNAERPASAATTRGVHKRFKSMSRETNGPAQFAGTHDRDGTSWNYFRTKNSPKECAACGAQFRLQRSTARFCSPRCRKAAQRTRDRGTPTSVAPTRPSVAPDAFLSVTATIGISEEQKTQGVTLRQPRKPPNINPRIAADP